MRFCISSNDKKFFREICPCDSVSRFFARFSFHSRGPSFLINVRTMRGLAVLLFKFWVMYVFVPLFFHVQSSALWNTLFHCPLHPRQFVLHVSLTFKMQLPLWSRKRDYRLSLSIFSPVSLIYLALFLFYKKQEKNKAN